MVRLMLVLSLLFFSAAAGAGGFSLRDTAGRVHNLDDYRGKWVLVNFWATWCPPCLEEIPDLVALHDKHKDKDLVVIGVAMEYRDPRQVLEFAENNFISYPVVLGNAKVAAQIGKVEGLPTSYLFNPQGKKVAHNVGALTRQAVESYIAAKR